MLIRMATGEFVSPNETSFFHYKDFWSFDLGTNEWEKLEVKGRPSPRSGHRMAAYKNLIVLFGGFYDTARETKYYDDLWVFDTLSYKVCYLSLISVTVNNVDKIVDTIGTPRSKTQSKIRLPILL